MFTRFSAALGLVVAGCASAPQTPPGAAPPGDTIRYEIAFPHATRHEAEVTVSWTGLAPGPLALRMSRSSPGRYALHEFGKNVYNVRVVDGADRALRITRPNPHQWDVHGHDGTVRLTYTLFADRADGTYSAIDATHAHMNMPATFMWARGAEARPVAITFRVPEGSGWRVATQLRPTADSTRFTAPHLQYFMDSPTELSAFDVRAWQDTSGDRVQTIRIAIHHRGTAEQLDAYERAVRGIVTQQKAVFGELPRFDFGTYTFIADYLPWVNGDGMEHRNSTILTSTGSLANPLGVLGTVSHEFFHAWNVERIRPASLEPFDFEKANMSGELWFAEGFTSYYGPLTLRRAGLYDDAQYANSIAGTINTVVNAPGRRYFSAVEMSMQAPFVDAATSVDPQNRANTFISYYTWGAGLGLALDLAIRARFPGRTLDDFMRALWARHGVHERDHTPLRPYTDDDLRTTLGEVLGDATFADDFFRRFIHGQDAPDYAALLAPAGILVRAASAGTPTIGAAHVDVRDGALVLAGPVLAGTTLYEAGASPGDRIIAVNGRTVTSPDELAAVVSALRPGERVEVTYEQRSVRITRNAPVQEDTTLEVVLYESAGMQVTEGMRRFRQDWLGGLQ